MSETNNGEISINPPDLRGEKGPVAWFVRKIQRVLGVSPKTETEPTTAPPTQSSNPTTGK